MYSLLGLDCYSGFGGWSDGLASEGFMMVGIELIPIAAEKYREAGHQPIIADMRSPPIRDVHFDLIVGSPPCRDFSTIARLYGHTWKRPPDPEGTGMELVTAFLNFVKEMKPRYWAMENVPDLRNYLDVKARMTTKIGEHMRRSFWGNFPAFLVPRDMNKKKFFTGSNGWLIPRADLYPRKHAKWLRAKMPFPLANALGKAVRLSLEESRP